MKCLTCGSEMDREDHFNSYSDDKLIPAADYECSECGRVVTWQLGRGFEVVYDPREDRQPTYQQMG
jgi:DNA-directed RNA polymerase subunit RPC12/RpoP